MGKGKALDDELEAYRIRIGDYEFKRQYLYAYHFTQNSKRFSGNIYTNSEEKLEQLREKYKNGVPDGIVETMVKDFIK